MGLKELIKEPIIDKWNGFYDYCLDEAYVSYDSWIKALEEKRYEKLEADGEDVEVISYKSMFEGFSIQSLKHDLVIFTSDKECLDNHAKAVISYFFEKKPDIKFIYGDEDELNSNETVRMNPYYKPDYSPDTLMSFFYIGNWFAVRKSELKKVCGKIDEFDDEYACIYDLVLRLTEGMKRREILHINAVLFHSHAISPLCDSKEYKSVRNAAYERRLAKSEYKDMELVSVVIPSKDHPNELKNLLESFITLTRDVRYELIIIDNGSNDDNKAQIEDMIEGMKNLSKLLVSDENKANIGVCEDIRYIYEKMPFNFSRMCNHGAKAAKGDFVLFLNDDMAVRVGNWLKHMLDYAKLTHVGTVGAKLYYPDSNVLQHAGVSNLRVGPVHKLQYKEDNVKYYFHAADCVRDVIAVTGACLLIRKELFDDMGGFSEELEVAYNDVDLCFRIYESGYYNVVCNDTHLWHYESLSRGGDEEREKLERLLREREMLYRRHASLYAKDPFSHKYIQSDIADVNYSFIHEYDIKANEQETVPGVLKRALKPDEENECVSISIEWAGDRDKWIDSNSDEGDSIYIQGYGFVAGSDNSLYARAILLQGEKELFVIGVRDVFRPELEMNVDPLMMACMCGFEVSFKKECIPKGEYRVGVIAFSRYSKNRLYNFTNRYISI